MTEFTDRPDAALVDAVRGIGTATLHEAGGQIGALPSYIKPVSNDWYVCGAAMTVLSPPKDNLWLHRGIYHAQPGEVMVVDTGGFHEAGYWGEIMTHAAQQVGIAGLVIDGCVRDGSILGRTGHARLLGGALHPGAPPRTRRPTAPSTSPSASARYG